MFNFKRCQNANISCFYWETWKKKVLFKYFNNICFLTMPFWWKQHKTTHLIVLHAFSIMIILLSSKSHPSCRVKTSLTPPNMYNVIYNLLLLFIISTTSTKIKFTLNLSFIQMSDYKYTLQYRASELSDDDSSCVYGAVNKHHCTRHY